jgi:putative ABC transport system substrate-binding protein
MRYWIKLLLSAAALALSLPAAGTAQPQPKVWKIGILEPFNAAVRVKFVDALRDGLRQLGYEEGRNYVFEPRFADGKLERLPGMASDLVRLNVDVIVASSTQAIQAAQRATRTIPIIMTTVGDPVGPGFVASYAKPGGNITGLTIQAPELIAKRVQLLKEAVPHVSRIATIWEPSVVHEVHGFAEAERAAQALGVSLLSINVKRPEDLDAAVAGVAREGADGLLVFENALTSNNGKRIVELALKHRLPAIFGLGALAEAGGLMAYGPVRVDNYRRAATFIDKIFKGAKPGDLPVEQPIKFEFVVNLKTARTLGLTLPQAVLLRADQLVD